MICAAMATKTEREEIRKKISLALGARLCKNRHQTALLVPIMRTIFAHLCQLGPGLAASDRGGMARRRMAWKRALRERDQQLLLCG